MDLAAVDELTNVRMIKTPGQRFGWYMIHSYLYYVLNETIINDDDFNKLCQQLILDWDTLEHPHKHLTTLEDLKCSSGNTIKFPLMVQSAAFKVLRDYRAAMAAPEYKPTLTKIKVKIKKL